MLFEASLSFKYSSRSGILGQKQVILIGEGNHTPLPRERAKTGCVGSSDRCFFHEQKGQSHVFPVGRERMPSSMCSSRGIFMLCSSPILFALYVLLCLVEQTYDLIIRNLRKTLVKCPNSIEEGWDFKAYKLID